MSRVSLLVVVVLLLVEADLLCDDEEGILRGDEINDDDEVVLWIGWLLIPEISGEFPVLDIFLFYSNGFWCVI